MVQNHLSLNVEKTKIKDICTTEEDEASLHREKQKELLDSSVLKRLAYLFLGVALLALCVLGGAKSFGFKC